MIPGRIRWHIPALAAPHLGDQFTRSLNEAAGVISVTVNPRTQSLLVMHDRSTTIDELEALFTRKTAFSSISLPVDEPLSENDAVFRAPDALLGALAAMGAGGASLLRILALGVAINAIAGTGPAAPIAGAVTVMAGATLANLELKRLNARLWHRLGRRVEFETRMGLFRRLLNSAMAAHDHRSIKELSTSVQNNLAQIERGFDGLGEIASVAANTMLLTLAFAVLAPQLLWIPLLALGAMSIVIWRGYEASKTRYGLSGTARVAADRRMAEAIDALPTVKAFNLEDRLLQETRQEASVYRERGTKASERGLHFPLALEGITMFGVAITTIAAGLALAAGTINPGTYLALMMISGHLFYPFSHLGQPLESALRALAAHRELSRLGSLPLESDTGVVVTPNPTRAPSIDCKDVSFAYPSSDRLAVEKLTLRVDRGSIVGIVGMSGSGKSTLTKLLLRFYDPLTGSVQIDGVDIRHFRRHDLRNLIACVDQRTFLFEGSVHYNIALGRPDADQAEIVDAAQAAGIHDFICGLTDGYATEIGVRGSKLSDGQRQRILIARGLLKRAPILILDEATSSLDVETERIVLAKIRQRVKGRTVIMVSHRLANLVDSDMIVVLKNGRIVDMGDHASLRRDSGYYRSLLDDQA